MTALSPPRVLLNGSPTATLDPADRGLAYGDGLFRTLRLRDGTPCLWDWHWARLQADCAALALPCPEAATLLAELHRVSADLPQAIGKITLTRGLAPRGYAPPTLPQTHATRVVQAAPRVTSPLWTSPHGVTVRDCTLQLSAQPRLAGVKHLNRLENVLARAEWHDPKVAEGLLYTAAGQLIEGTMSNVFVRHGTRLRTPRLDQCGVAGAVRAWLLDTAPLLGLTAEEAALTAADLVTADEVWLCNTVIGVVPVARWRDQTWEAFALLPRVAAVWAREMGEGEAATSA